MDPNGTNPQETPQSQDEKLKQIRTYQGDIAEALGEQKESLVSIQRAEVVKKASEPKPVPEEDSGFKKALLLFVGTLVLVALAGGIGWYSYKTYKEKTKLPEVSIPANQFITPTNTKNLDASGLDRASLIDVLSGEISLMSALPIGNIEQVEFYRSSATSTLLDTESFFKIATTRAPASLIRSFGPYFMYGIISGKEMSSFLLIELDSFPNAYPGMLSWESSVAEDLVPLFATRNFIQNIAPGTSFTDITVKNRDARILRDQLGNTVILYAFYGNKMLVITDSIDTLLQIESKLDTRELVR